MTIEISVPDIGDFESVEIIEILVKPGDTINKNDPDVGVIFKYNYLQIEKLPAWLSIVRSNRKNVGVAFGENIFWEQWEKYINDFTDLISVSIKNNKETQTFKEKILNFRETQEEEFNMDIVLISYKQYNKIPKAMLH